MTSASVARIRFAQTAFTLGYMTAPAGTAGRFYFIIAPPAKKGDMALCSV